MSLPYSNPVPRLWGSPENYTLLGFCLRFKDRTIVPESLGSEGIAVSETQAQQAGIHLHCLVDLLRDYAKVSGRIYKYCQGRRSAAVM